jgi:hypothetical protein
MPPALALHFGELSTQEGRALLCPGCARPLRLALASSGPASSSISEQSRVEAVVTATGGAQLVTAGMPLGVRVSACEATSPVGIDGLACAGELALDGPRHAVVAALSALTLRAGASCNAATPTVEVRARARWASAAGAGGGDTEDTRPAWVNASLRVAVTHGAAAAGGTAGAPYDCR